MKKQTKRVLAGIITAPIWFIPGLALISLLIVILLIGYATTGEWNKDYGAW